MEQIDTTTAVREPSRRRLAVVARAFLAANGLL
jgi:hypothetical protein